MSTSLLHDTTDIAEVIDWADIERQILIQELNDWFDIPEVHWLGLEDEILPIGPEWIDYSPPPEKPDEAGVEDLISTGYYNPPTSPTPRVLPKRREVQEQIRTGQIKKVELPHPTMSRPIDPEVQEYMAKHMERLAAPLYGPAYDELAQTMEDLLDELPAELTEAWQRWKDAPQ